MPNNTGKVKVIKQLENGAHVQQLTVQYGIRSKLYAIWGKRSNTFSYVVSSDSRDWLKVLVEVLDKAMHTCFKQ